MYTYVVSSGLPNYSSAKFVIPSNLNIKGWAKYLYKDSDKELLSHICHGFPTGFLGPISSHSYLKNHPSSNNYPDHMDEYIREEVAQGALLGPFDENPFEWSHISAYMTRSKADPNKRRVINDLTYPLSHSVNSYIPKGVIDGKNFTHELPSVDDIVKSLNDNPDRCIMFCEDISRAYRNFRTEITSWPLNVSIWREKYYIDCSMAFGSRLSSLNMQRVAAKIVEILRDEGIYSYMYLDDLICLNSSYEEANKNQKRVQQLFSELGLPIAKEKSSPPSHVIKWLGINIDSMNNLLYIPSQKLNDLIDFSNKLFVKDYITKKQLQSILGKTFYIGKCIRPVRAFTSRLLQTLRNHHKENRIKVTDQMYKDISWFKNFAAEWNGVTIIPKLQEIQTIYVHSEKYMCYGSDGIVTYELKLECDGLSQLLVAAINVWIAIQNFAIMHPGLKIRVITSNPRVEDVFMIANNNDESLNELARLFWLSKAHLNCQCYFGYKYLQRAKGENSYAFRDSAFSLPKIRIDSQILHKVYLFILSCQNINSVQHHKITH